MEGTTDSERFEAEFEPRILDKQELAEVAGGITNVTGNTKCHSDPTDPDCD